MFKRSNSARLLLSSRYRENDSCMIRAWTRKPTKVQDFLLKRTTATASATSATATTAGASTAAVLLPLLSWGLKPATQKFSNYINFFW